MCRRPHPDAPAVGMFTFWSSVARLQTSITLQDGCFGTSTLMRLTALFLPGGSLTERDTPSAEAAQPGSTTSEQQERLLHEAASSHGSAEPGGLPEATESRTAVGGSPPASTAGQGVAAPAEEVVPAMTEGVEGGQAEAAKAGLQCHPSSERGQVQLALSPAGTASPPALDDEAAILAGQAGEPASSPAGDSSQRGAGLGQCSGLSDETEGKHSDMGTAFEAGSRQSGAQPHSNPAAEVPLQKQAEQLSLELIRCTAINPPGKDPPAGSTDAMKPGSKAGKGAAPPGSSSSRLHEVRLDVGYCLLQLPLDLPAEHPRPHPVLLSLERRPTGASAPDLTTAGTTGPAVAGQPEGPCATPAVTASPFAAPQQQTAIVLASDLVLHIALPEAQASRLRVAEVPPLLSIPSAHMVAVAPRALAHPALQEQLGCRELLPSFETSVPLMKVMADPQQLQTIAAAHARSSLEMRLIRGHCLLLGSQQRWVQRPDTSLPASGMQAVKGSCTSFTFRQPSLDVTTMTWHCNHCLEQAC